MNRLTKEQLSAQYRRNAAQLRKMAAEAPAKPRKGQFTAAECLKYSAQCANRAEDGEKGDGEVKATCLWMKGLPALVPTTPNEPGRHPACWLASPGKNRKTDRSRTYPGIARAMAEQWATL